MELSIDSSELRAWADEVRRAGQTLPQAIRPPVQKGALNIKTTMNADFAGSEAFKGLSGSVNYQSREGRDFAEAEIGPDKGRFPGVPGPGVTRPAAPLANIAYFGGAHSGGGTVRDPQEVLDEEAPRFEKALLDVIDGLLR